MATGSLDTNVLLRLLLNDIPEQHTAVKKLLANGTIPFFVHDIAIVELVYVLQKYYRFSRNEIGDSIQGLIDLSEIVVSDEVLIELAIALYINHPSLSFEDCYLAYHAHVSTTEPLWTFDRKLAHQIDGVSLVS